jgi:uncharacterized protein YjiS (DUF1127 family)
MYRMMNETAMLSQAAPAGVATPVSHDTGMTALSRFATVLVDSVRAHFKRAAIERELSRLDNRMLDDLALTRDDIVEVAAQAAAVPGRGTLFAEFSRLVVNLVVRPLVEWNRRREIYDTLMAMDERMLSDIGMTRYEAAEYVRRLGREIQEPLPEALAAMEQDITAPLRAWNRARATERQLNELSDRQLLDIGVVRGDITELAQEVARKAVANFNDEAQASRAA